MSDIKSVVNMVLEEILNKGYDVEAFYAWLGDKKPQGQFLEQWSLPELAPLVKEYTQTKEMLAVNAKAVNSSSEEEEVSYCLGEEAWKQTASPQLWSLEILK